MRSRRSPTSSTRCASSTAVAPRASRSAPTCRRPTTARFRSACAAACGPMAAVTAGTSTRPGRTRRYGPASRGSCGCARGASTRVTTASTRLPSATARTRTKTPARHAMAPSGSVAPRARPWRRPEPPPPSLAGVPAFAARLAAGLEALGPDPPLAARGAATGARLGPDARLAAWAGLPPDPRRILVPDAARSAALDLGAGPLHVTPAALLAGLDVAADLGALLLAALVGLLEDALGHRAAAEPEGEREPQGERPDDRGEQDLDDLGGDVELGQDHEDRHREHERGNHRLDEVAGRGVAHRALGEPAGGAGDRRGDDEDQDRHDHVRQVGEHLVHEAGHRGDLERPDRRGQGDDEDQPEGDRAHEPRGRGAGREALDVVAGRRLVQAAVDVQATQQAHDHRLDDAGDDVAHEQDHDEADQLREEAQEIGERGLQAREDVYGGERWHVPLPFLDAGNCVRSISLPLPLQTPRPRMTEGVRSEASRRGVSW